MYTVLVALAVVIAILLILIVLVQNSKGGGLSSSFAAQNSMMGVRKTTDFLEKATWTLVGILVVLSVASAAFLNNNSNKEEALSAKDQMIENAPAPSNDFAPSTEAAAE